MIYLPAVYAYFFFTYCGIRVIYMRQYEDSEKNKTNYGKLQSNKFVFFLNIFLDFFPFENIKVNILSTYPIYKNNF